jgi:arginine decarboxylase
MEIFVTSGVGKGRTKMAALDAALCSAGIANFNLLKLSSIIPTGSIVKVSQPPVDQANDFGKRLYVVIAERTEVEIGREAWAGLGWVQTKDGRGIFVEQGGAQEAEVVRLIEETLLDMAKFRQWELGEMHRETIGIRCENEPVCALVAAVYQVEKWAGIRRLKGLGNATEDFSKAGRAKTISALPGRN